MSIFAPVERTIDPSASEKRWLEFWKERRIFQKQLDQSRHRARTEGKSTYVFYEGPPTANGMPHPGHVLTRVVKDLFPRFRAMQGYDVPRKAGWDTHGLPVEIEVEKELGIEGKQGIESYGIEPFVQKCKASVFRYSDAWAKMTERIAFWIDLDDPYVTYHTSYIESVWWSLEELWHAGFLYHGAKIVPWCPRCGTALSSHEVGLGYKEVSDPSAYVAFRSTEDPKLFYLAWTTTPWTLLSNVALAVGVNYDYDYVRVEDETLVMASALRSQVMGKIPHTVWKTVKGGDLVGKRYEQLFPYAKVEKPAFRIVAGDFVGLDAGTGIVHIAPAFGEDDYRVGQAEDLPVINLVRPDGTFVDAVTPWHGMFVKEADPLILKVLRERKQLLKSETYTHDYPFCWRCPSPLLYYPRPAWYIRTTEVKEEMLRNNAAITWLPEHIRDGRFGNFLESNVDWALSRERYWGTPLPIWTCTDCGHQTLIGSRNELHDQAWPETLSAGHGPDGEIELHRPYVDRIELVCAQCEGRMRRVPEVIDCWYDSGAMPFAQWGYPYVPGSEEKLNAALPADFISEAIDQTRGWFYSLLAIATLLKACGEKKKKAGKPLGAVAPWYERPYPLPYRRCLVLGHVCDEKGFKMSKSKGNYLDPWTILEREGADALRWYFYRSNQPWTSVRFFAEAIRDSQREFLLRLRNVYSFFVIYANLDGFDPSQGVGNPLSPDHRAFAQGACFVPLRDRSLLDRWMISKLEHATAEVTRHLEAMNILAAAQTLDTLVDGLSNWYVRRSRDRFWQAEKTREKWAAYSTLYEALTRLSLLLAPFTPFFAEELYQHLVQALFPSLPESVHLCSWPAVDLSAVDREIERQMDLAREIASLGLAARAAQKIKVRQPLREAIVILNHREDAAAMKELGDVLREELNVKTITFAPEASAYVRYTVKPDFKTLGPKLGSKVKSCASLLATLDAAQVVQTLERDGSIEVTLNGERYRLSKDELDIRLQAKPGFAAAGGGGAVVVLDATITEELEREGLAREIVNRIQNMRKEWDLPYEARIAVRIGAGGKVARAAIEHAQSIAYETLATDFAVRFEELDFTKTMTIENEEVRISIRRIGD